MPWVDNSHVWSDHEPVASNPLQAQLFKLGLFGAGVSATAYSLHRMTASTGAYGTDRHNIFDFVGNTADFLGNLSPYGIGNTFKIPQFLSPFYSTLNKIRPTESLSSISEEYSEKETVFKLNKAIANKNKKQEKALQKKLERNAEHPLAEIARRIIREDKRNTPGSIIRESGNVVDSANNNIILWNKAQSTNRSTITYLKEGFGLSDEILKEAGLLLEESVMEGKSSVGLAYVADKSGKSPYGKLYSVLDDGREVLLSERVQLMIRGEAFNDLLPESSSHSNMNKAFYGVLQSLDLWRVENFRATDVFGGPGVLAPIPAFNLKGVDSLSALKRATALPRGIAAFEIDRFNNLVDSLFNETVGKSGKDFFKRATGLGVVTTPGPAYHTFVRIGGRAVMLGGAYMGVQQADWIKRRFGPVGESLGSSAISAGIGLAVARGTGNNRLGIVAGATSFVGQLVLPGFDRGVVEGVASTAASLDIWRASDANIFSHYRRNAEGALPGISSFETGVFFGLGVLGASYLKLPYFNETASTLLLDRFKGDILGEGIGENAYVKPLKSARDVFWATLSRQTINADSSDIRKIALSLGEEDFEETASLASRFRIFTETISGGSVTNPLEDLSKTFYAYASYLNPKKWLDEDKSKAMKRLSEVFYEANITAKELSFEDTHIGENYVKSMKAIEEKYSKAKSPFLGSLQREVHGFLNEVKYFFFGLNKSEEGVSNYVADSSFGKIDISEFTENAPGWGKSFKKLNISPVGKLGRASTLFFSALAIQQIGTGALFGSMENRDDLRAIYSGNKKIEVKRSRWWEAGGTPYGGGDLYYEREHAYSLMMKRVRERGVWGEDEDKISPMRKFFLKNFTYYLERERHEDRPYPVTSAAFSDIPVIGNLLSMSIGRFIKPVKFMHQDEWVQKTSDGTVAYASPNIGSEADIIKMGGLGPGKPKSPYTLSQAYASNVAQFRELEGLTGWAKNTINSQLLGISSFDTDSPILAESGQMTSMSVRFWETQQGGAGFLNEGLRRIFKKDRKEYSKSNPIENTMPSWLPKRFRYGDPYRSIEWGEARLPGVGYETLNKDIAGVPYEDYSAVHKFAILADVAPFSSELKIAQKEAYKMRALNQLSSREINLIEKTDKSLSKKYAIKDFDELHENANDFFWLRGIRQSYNLSKQTLLNVAEPFEYLIPLGFRPTQKLLGDRRDPISQYEHERISGTDLAFWDEPWRDWFRPAMTSMVNLITPYTFKGNHRLEYERNSEYFDKLEFIKYMRLAEEAEASGNKGEARKWKIKASRTRAGISEESSMQDIYWSMPKEERAFFDAFARASKRERRKIKKLVPKDYVRMYENVWNKIDNGDIDLMKSTSIDGEFLKEQYENIQENISGSIPREDWVGWNEDVSMDSVRVKYVSKLSRNIHDYNVWEKQVKDVERMSYLEGTESQISYGGGVVGSIARSIPFLGANSLQSFNTGRISGANIEYNDNREREIKQGIREYVNGY